MRLRKVKGHATLEDVAKGRVEPFDRWGNDKADALAVAGARMHAVSPRRARAAHWRTRVARDMQLMCVEIEHARRERDRARGGGDGSDGSSDEGDRGEDDARAAAAQGAAAAAAPASAAYPFGWDPPGPRDAIVLRGRDRITACSGATGYGFGQRTFDVLGQYLSELRWPPEGAPGGEAGITWVELAVDYEVATGHDLPPALRDLTAGDKALAQARSEASRTLAREAYVVDAQRGATGAQPEPAEERRHGREEIRQLRLAAGQAPGWQLGDGSRSVEAFVRGVARGSPAERGMHARLQVEGREPATLVLRGAAGDPRRGDAAGAAPTSRGPARTGGRRRGRGGSERHGDAHTVPGQREGAHHGGRSPLHGAAARAGGGAVRNGRGRGAVPPTAGRQGERARGAAQAAAAGRRRGDGGGHPRDRADTHPP